MLAADCSDMQRLLVEDSEFSIAFSGSWTINEFRTPFPAESKFSQLSGRFSLRDRIQSSIVYAAEFWLTSARHAPSLDDMQGPRNCGLERVGRDC